MSSLRLEVFHGPSGLERLARDWNHLAERIPGKSCVHLWEWHRSYLAALAPAPEQALYCAFYASGEPVAILPLERATERLMGLALDTLRLPAHAHVPYGDVLLHPRARLDMRLLIRALRRAGLRWDLLLMGRVLADSAVASLMRARPESRYAGLPAALLPGLPGGLPAGLHARLSAGLWAVEEVGASDALPTLPYEELLARMSKNFRGSLRKTRNRLARLANVRFVSARTPAALADAYPAFLEVEASGWKGAAGTAIKLDPRLRAFYGQLIAHLGPSGRCEIHLLVAGEQVIAAQLAILADERCYVLKIGHDEGYRHLAPGNMLLEHLLERYQGDAEIAYVDLVSNAAWHRSWNPIVREVLCFYLFQPSPRGLLAWSGLRGKQVLRPAYHEVRARARDVAAQTRAVGARTRAVAARTGATPS